MPRVISWISPALRIGGGGAFPGEATFPGETMFPSVQTAVAAPTRLEWGGPIVLALPGDDLLPGFIPSVGDGVRPITWTPE